MSFPHIHMYMYLPSARVASLIRPPQIHSPTSSSAKQLFTHSAVNERRKKRCPSSSCMRAFSTSRGAKLTCAQMPESYVQHTRAVGVWFIIYIMYKISHSFLPAGPLFCNVFTVKTLQNKGPEWRSEMAFGRGMGFHLLFSLRAQASFG